MKVLWSLLTASLLAQNAFWDNIQNEVVQQNKLIAQQAAGISNLLPPTTDFQEFITVDGDENQHIQDIKKISQKASDVEKKYSECVQKIPNDDYTASKLDACIGKEAIFVVDDFDYISRLVKGQYISRLQAFMIEMCYGPAGNDINFSKAC